jgi:hypothetical protein
MSRIEIILSAVLFFSTLFNVGIFIYARSAIRRLLMVSEELGDLQSMVNAFAKHVKSVYELEMFYGDATLEHLLNHAVSFNEQLETFEYVYTLTEEEAELTEDEQKELFDDAEENQAPPA